MAAALANARRSVAFVQDQCADGRRFRNLNAIGDVTKLWPPKSGHCPVGFLRADTMLRATLLRWVVE